MKTKSYCQERLDVLGISPEMNSFNIMELQSGQRREISFFVPDAKSDDILIHYVSLYGEREVYLKSRKEIPFVVRRKKVVERGAKYISPAGASTRPFFPGVIIEKFQRKEKIKTLIVTEGQFKAFKGCMHGLDVIGVSGIHNLKNKAKDRLHEDLAAIIEICQVENVVFLIDADLKEVHYAVDPEDPVAEENRDLAKRPFSFCSAVNNFKELLKAFEVETYFCHIREELSVKAKGLDDLLVLHKDREEKVVEDLLLLGSAPQKFFKTLQLSKMSYPKLKQYFYINNVQDFYTAYSHIIGNGIFTWLRGKYQYKDNGEGGEVELLRHPDSYMYIRVGCDYYKKINKLNAAGELEPQLKIWRVGEIQRDYVYTKVCPSIFSMIPKFDCFTNYPDHSENYKQIIKAQDSVNYNMYFPMPHKLQHGSWETVEKFIRHIFGEQYAMGMDYLTILYRFPLQKQYILCLVNELRNTGKSTFLFFLRMMFGENVTIASSDDFNDSFNSSYASKLVVGIDEGFIDKKTVLERLKSLSTSPKINMNAKGRDKQEIDFFAKFVLTSNDERNFVNIDEQEIRFWVVKVPQFQKEDPDLLAKMKTEMPAFIHHLAYREITHPKKSRMWFAPNLVVTEALRHIKQSSKSWIEKSIIHYVTSLMKDFGEERILLTLSDIVHYLNKEQGNRYKDFHIAQTLKEKMRLKPLKQQRYKIPRWDFGEYADLKSFTKKNGRPYEFLAKNFLSEEEIREVQETRVQLEGSV